MKMENCSSERFVPDGRTFLHYGAVCMKSHKGTERGGADETMTGW
jgi:hypothetical protein